MKKAITSIFFTLLLGAAITTTLEGRCCCPRYNRGATAVGFFAGAFAGAALAGAYNDCGPCYPYYGYGPRLIYTYDYPAFAYSPLYAYPNTRYTYPGFYVGF